MHTNAQRWDDELVTLTLPDYANGARAVRLEQVRRGSLERPTYDRPCDWCGLPLLADGIHIHAHCIKPERVALMESVERIRPARS